MKKLLLNRYDDELYIALWKSRALRKLKIETSLEKGGHQ